MDAVARKGRFRVLETIALTEAVPADSADFASAVEFLSIDGHPESAAVTRKLSDAAGEHDTQTLLTLAEHSDAHGHRGRAERLYRRACTLFVEAERDPKSPKRGKQLLERVEAAYLRIVQYAEDREDVAELKRIQQEAGSCRSVSGLVYHKALLAAGRLHAAKGHRYKSEQLLKSALAAYGKRDGDLKSACFVGLGLCRSACEDHAGAEHFYQRAWKLDPNPDAESWRPANIGKTGLLALARFRLRAGAASDSVQLSQMLCEHASRFGDRRTQARALCVMATAYRALQGDGDSAEVGQAYEAALSSARLLDDGRLAAQIENERDEQLAGHLQLPGKRTDRLRRLGWRLGDFAYPRSADPALSLLISMCVTAIGPISYLWPVIGVILTGIAAGTVVFPTRYDTTMAERLVVAVSQSVIWIPAFLLFATLGNTLVSRLFLTDTQVVTVVGFSASLTCYVTVIYVVGGPLDDWGQDDHLLRASRTALCCVVSGAVLVSLWIFGDVVAWWPLDASDIPFGESKIP